MVTAQNVVKELCKMGLHGVEVYYDEDKEVLGYNLNTGAKSGLILYEDLLVVGRYDYIREQYQANQSVDDIIRGLFWMFDACLCGRDYCNTEWKDIGVQLGIIEKVVSTHTTVEYI